MKTDRIYNDVKKTVSKLLAEGVDMVTKNKKWVVVIGLLYILYNLLKEEGVGGELDE